MKSNTMGRIAPSATESAAFSFRPLLSTWAVLLRYAPVGLIGVTLLLLLTVALAVALKRPDSPSLVLPAFLAPALIGAMAQGFAAALIGSGVGQLEQRLNTLRAPSGQARLRQAAALSWLLLWLLPAMLWIGLPSVGHGWWLWPLCAAAGASAIGVAALLTLSPAARLWGWVTIVAVIGVSSGAPRVGPLLARVPDAGQGWQLAVSLASLGCIGLVALGILRWMRKPAADAAPMGPSGEATLEAPALAHAPAMHTRPSLDRLVMPGPQRVRRADVGSALLIAACYGAVLHLWVPSPNLAMLVMFAWAASLDAPVHARSGGMSARALLLPGGLHREGLLLQVFTMTVRRSWRRAVALTLPALVVLCAATDLRATQVAAIVPALAGALIWSCALAAAWIAITPASRQLIAAALPGAGLFGSALWMTRASSTAPTDASAWLAWSAGTGGLAVVLAALTLAIALRPVRRLDGRRLGPLPDRPGQRV